MRAIAALAVAASLVGACTLTTSLDGLSGGPSAPDGGDASGGDAMMGGGDGSTAADTSVPTDAGMSYRAIVLSDAPLAYYRLNDANDVAKDEVGKHDGQYVGTLMHAPGAIKGDGDLGAVFDGAHSFVDVGDNFSFTDRSPFTLEAWVKPKAGASDPQCVTSKTFAPGGASGGVADGYSLYVNTDATLQCTRFKSSNTEGADGPAIDTTSYSHLTVTYDGTVIALFVNGARVGQGTSTQSILGVSHFTIGAGRGGVYCYFDGAIDEVAVYGVALAPERIKAHYAAGTGAK